jgi:hypothetical protein
VSVTRKQNAAQLAILTGAARTVSSGVIVHYQIRRIAAMRAKATPSNASH